MVLWTLSLAFHKSSAFRFRQTHRVSLGSHGRIKQHVYVVYDLIFTKHIMV